MENKERAKGSIVFLLLRKNATWTWTIPDLLPLSLEMLIMCERWSSWPSWTKKKQESLLLLECNSLSSFKVPQLPFYVYDSLLFLPSDLFFLYA